MLVNVHLPNGLTKLVNVFLQFVITTIFTYFGQIDFPFGFLDDSFNARRQHFTWIAPSKGKNSTKKKLKLKLMVGLTRLTPMQNHSHLRCKKIDDNRRLAIFHPFVEILHTLDVINFL